MSDATKRTCRSQTKCRADENFGAVDLVYIETIHADGRVEWSVKGIEDDEYVNKSGVRYAEMAIDFERIHKARTTSGWTEVTK